jgi:murein DD-endopeptidase
VNSGDEPLGVAEVFGLRPFRQRVREAVLSFRGDGVTPPSRFDHTSLKMFRPRIALPLWVGVPARGRVVPIYNLFNYLQPPPEEGWSTRVTRVRDFLGTALSYDSHNATDFAVPVGTAVVAPAPGVVRRVSSEFNRGGLKVFIDHGDGLVTTSNHLARALVRVGDRVRRGDVIARSGYSGLDGVATFPWGAPHVHFNTWLNGDYVDPFAAPGETSLWRTGNWPTPHREPAGDEELVATDWNDDALEATLAACVHEATRAEVRAIEDRDERAVALMFHRNYYPSRFRARHGLYRTLGARRPRLDLPFRARDFDGIWFPHGVEPPR